MNVLITTDKTSLLASTSALNSTYKRVVSKYINAYNSIDIESIKDFLTSVKENYSSSTFNVYKQAIKKWITSNVTDLNMIARIDVVFKDMKTATKTKAIKSNDVVDLDTVKSMIDRVDIKDKLIIELLYKSGLRVSELVNIKLKDCELINSNGSICVNILIHGKGNKERYINIDTDLFDRIRTAFNGKVLLFETVNHKAITRQFIYKVVNRAGKRVLGTRQVHPHTLRHSFATHLLVKENKSLKAVSNYLGHSSTSITSDYYIHDSLTINDIQQSIRL